METETEIASWYWRGLIFTPPCDLCQWQTFIELTFGRNRSSLSENKYNWIGASTGVFAKLHCHRNFTCLHSFSHYVTRSLCKLRFDPAPLIYPTEGDLYFGGVGFVLAWEGPPLAGTSRNMYWQSFNEDMVSAARHSFGYTSSMVRWIYFGALDGPQTTEAPYATLLIYLHTGRTILWKQLVAVANPHCQDLWRNVS